MPTTSSPLPDQPTTEGTTLDHTGDNSPTSRLKEFEEKKTVRRSLLIIGFSVVLFLLFLVFGLPFFFGVFVNLVGSGLEEEVVVSPQSPSISVPFEATNSASVQVVGYAQSGAEVSLRRASSTLGRVVASEDGSFSQLISLQEGSNTVTAVAIHNGLESVASTPLTILLDTKPPALEVNEPSDNASFTSRAEQELIISGSTDQEASVTINGRYTPVASDGTFTLTQQLVEGENTLTVVARDDVGNETTRELSVSFSL
ncbi:MAG: hypothetical protein H6774_03425 [Pseudomonadales bacterium]|nr:hypothetical protein [Candidatus Woesebacteria bacterium]MCB9802111.1 hypothetical protein [Pseudomonadales bacterium]